MFVSDGADGGPERRVSSSASVLGELGRLTLTRSVSEYNPRVPSRTAFSDTGCVYAPGEDLRTGYGGEAWRSPVDRNRSRSDHAVLPSPTRTAVAAVSSGSTATTTTRERPASTVLTSLSAGSYFFGSRDRDRELGREGSKLCAGGASSPDLKEKHPIEIGTLLYALSDSQRSVRVLRTIS